MLKGIDVSKAQGKIDWAKVKKAGVQFAMIRLGYGNDDVSQDDKTFEENVAGCEANGIPWGAYIYSYAMDTTEAKSEASHALRLLHGKKPTYPIAFDMEDADGYKAKRGGLSKEKAVNICTTFLSIVENSGYYVTLYASLSWLDGILNDKRLDKYDKWVAQWNTVCQYDKPYGMWQYGGSTNYIESPYINGINGAVDKDYAYYDYPTIIKENGLNGWEKPKTETPTETPAEKPQEKPQEKPTETPTEKPVETPAETDKPITETPAQGENENDTGKGIIETLKRLIKLIVEWAFGK